nr:EAL domain-containing protein [uncultured Tyzzerella sp.]
MGVFNRTYLKLALVSVSFTLIFYFFCSIMIDYILHSNMNLVFDVYYKQISEKVKNDILLLKLSNEYLAKNGVIIEYLKQSREDYENTTIKKEQVLDEVKDIEKVLSTISFVDSINIVDLANKHLFAKGRETKDFNITLRPWYDKNFFTSHNKNSKLTHKHRDYMTGKETISIVSLIYDDEDVTKYFRPIGTAILDIYVEDLLRYIDNSFYAGVLKTAIYPEDTDIAKLRKENKDYSIYVNKDILNNGEYLVFKFDKSSLLNGAVTETSLQKMRFVLLCVGIFVSILLFIAIRVCFSSALMSINKLKSILDKLNNNSYFVEGKNEFKQLEILADTLNKSFDDKIQELIYYDELTGLPNRKKLEYVCQDLINNNESFALIFIDLNKFKYINDVFGHSVGDEYLIKFSDMVSQLIGERGIMTRYSGDEFIIIYKNYIDNKELVDFYEENLVKAFINPIKINEELTTDIGFSAGVSVYPKDASSFEELIDKSDFMMYVNKKNFVNRRIAFFDEAMYESLLYSEKIKKELKMALKNNEFYLNYQPIVDKNKNILKAETLIRWNNKNLGFVPPDKFIKHLEETRQIVPVGYWIIEKVCEDIREAQLEKNNIQITINISPLQLMLKDFVSNVKNIIDRYNLDYKLICFEITENVLLDKKQYILENINKIRELGIQIALDDFGTGYSSFNYLRTYKLDILKIDRTFLKKNQKLDFDIINQIKELAHLLNMKVVIEGVETKEQFDIMGEINIDYLQGYYFSKPVLLDEFKKMLKG